MPWLWYRFPINFSRTNIADGNNYINWQTCLRTTAIAIKMQKDQIKSSFSRFSELKIELISQKTGFELSLIHRIGSVRKPTIANPEM
jgi:hypothetical protein